MSKKIQKCPLFLVDAIICAVVTEKVAHTFEERILLPHESSFHQVSDTVMADLNLAVSGVSFIFYFIELNRTNKPLPMTFSHYNIAC